MKKHHYKETPAVKFDSPEAKGVQLRIVIGAVEGASNFIMRVIEVERGGHTPFHKHPYEHENYIIKGSGMVVTEKEETPVFTGDVIYIEPNERHCYKNVGTEPLEFICVIPKRT